MESASTFPCDPRRRRRSWRRSRSTQTAPLSSFRVTSCIHRVERERIDARTLIDTGYSDAVRYLAQMRPDGVPLTYEATQMQDEPSGITFREMMTGSFALGETDPEAGAARGDSESSMLTMHATVTVHDVDRFVADPQHLGSLLGEIDFTPFGAGMPSTRGVFNLFAPSDVPRLKYMVYELAFMHDGRPYYLAGKKHVRDDVGFDLLSDTTTLYTTLHEGVDATGTVVGAGVLKLGMGDFAKLLTTVRPTGAHQVTDGTAAVMKFTRFFAGQLMETYGGALGHFIAGT